MHAEGGFDVNVAPLEPYNRDDDAQLARMSIDKTFHGDLEAASRGEMLSCGSPQSGSAGYVAIERVTGTLHGRRGSFALQHNATMHRGGFALNIIVVPGSGTGDLADLSGTMKIVIADGKHSYQFEYEIGNQG
ncbi:MAG TPA: DUF3224 domain-containing protein [Rhodanobacteraceae bacterium]|nr:DUF3224 domain-containing protein [Rhodanobacteraceae bacterium]